MDMRSRLDALVAVMYVFLPVLTISVGNCLGLMASQADTTNVGRYQRRRGVTTEASKPTRLSSKTVGIFVDVD
jgi:hypothetical protein